MISERQFANNYNSFWDSLCPMLTSFVSRINKAELERFSLPIEMASESTGDRGLINETAFILFSMGDFEAKKFDHALNQAFEKISKLDEGRILKEAPIEEVLELLVSYRKFLEIEKIDFNQVDFLVELKGCGFLDNCQGDFLYQNVLYESKCGDRNFRGSDLRQLLIYCALSYYETGIIHDFIGLVNARRGVRYTEKTDNVSYSISGLTAIDLFESIRVFLEGQRVSK